MTYVSIDLDWPSKFEITRAWYGVQQYGGEPRGRVSSGGHGVHIRNRMVLPERVPVAEAPRRDLGDDPKRVDRDVQNSGAPNQLLWDYKHGNRSDEWTDSLTELLSRYSGSVKLTPTQHKVKHGD